MAQHTKNNDPGAPPDAIAMATIPSEFLLGLQAERHEILRMFAKQILDGKHKLAPAQVAAIVWVLADLVDERRTLRTERDDLGADLTEVRDLMDKVSSAVTGINRIVNTRRGREG